MNVGAQTVLKVAANSNPNKVAGALAAMIRRYNSGSLQSIGTDANSQLVKAMAIAQRYVQEEGIKISFRTEMHEVEINGRPSAAIRIIAKSDKTVRWVYRNTRNSSLTIL